MSLKVDLHTHTEASHDCQSSVKDVIDYAEINGMDAIAITDHDSIESHEEALDLAEDKDLTVIPGIEISTKSGHLLGLNVTEKVESGLTLGDTIKKVRELGGVAVVPHPFQYFRHGINKKDLKTVEPDAIEVFNSRLILGIRNFQAERYAQKFGYPRVAGSDAHVPELVGTTYTVVEAENNIESIMKAVCNGKTDIQKNRTPITSFIKQVYMNNWKTSI